MAIRRIEQVSCSLNLGLIYSVDYQWSPDSGVSISVFFVNESGQYQKPNLLQKAFIRLGSAAFTVYPVSWKISLASGRRVIQVSFVDEFYQLKNHYVALTGKGCGYNVYTLGTNVDKRTSAQKQAAALDSSAQQIIEFTQFPDVEYTFNDFLAIVRTKFNVQITTAYDAIVTNAYTGTFLDVLQQWCAFFNLSFLFENGIIKIFNPSTVFINLPTMPTDAIEWEEEEDIRDTYGKTCFNWFQQEGGQFSLNQTSDQNGDLLVRTDTLFPLGYEFNLPQPNVNLYQVAASMYGPEFWFLYNYQLGSTSAECGWTPLSASSSLGIVRAAGALGAQIASVDQAKLAGKFDAYQQYGLNIAGRWYLSNEKSDLAIDRTYTWFDESNGQITSFTNVDDKTINLDFLTPTTPTINIVEGTAVNLYYSGINYRGNRMVYRDDFPSAQNAFTLTPAQTALINSTYQNLYDVGSSSSADFNSDLAPLYGTANTYVAYKPQVIPQDIVTLFNGLAGMVSGFLPRYTSVPVKGIRTIDYSSLKSSQAEPDNVDIVVGDQGGNVVSNTAVIKTLKDGAYTVYYNKYEQCGSAYSTSPTYFQHRFEPRQISSDCAISFAFNKDANNTYTINRDFSTINQLVNNPLLPTIAQGRAFNTRRVSFSVNYFKDIPGDFLTNGLVAMSVSVGGDGVVSSYTFSNEILTVPEYDDQFAAFEQQIRNSWIRRYQPNTVIT